MAIRVVRGTADGSVLSWEEPLCEHDSERPAFAADNGAGSYEVLMDCGCTAAISLHFEEVPQGVVIEVPDPEREAEMAQFAQFQEEQFRAWKAGQTT